MNKKAWKYTWVRWNPARIKQLFRAGKTQAQIARLIGYPWETGQNRVCRVLKSAGLK